MCPHKYQLELSIQYVKKTPNHRGNRLIGAGTTNIKEAFEKIFNRQGIKAAVIEGDSYHRYNREEMERLTRQAMREGRHITHFGPEGNLLKDLEAGFREYAEHGTGKQRFYIHNDADAARHGGRPAH